MKEKSIEQENKKNYHFEKLTPKSDTDIKVYEQALDFVFENDDVKNVAISGAYGSGKSSMLNSYKEKNPEHKFMHLSLAHFQTNSEEKKFDADEKVLEGKILNQLIHQISANKIPQTNFKVKNKISIARVLWMTVSLLFFVLSIFHSCFFNAWASFVSTISRPSVRGFLNLTTNPESRLISALIAVSLFGFFIFKIIKAQLNKHIFQKLNIQGNEIEIFKNEEESYFDKYLNEVLYLFENVDVDVIVFEDMDRFNAHQIFERLREINNLVNLQLIKKKKVLRFFYLLKDDIFISKDRTKFFDFILPIVPVLDGSNSYDQFLEHFSRIGLLDKFTPQFLQGLSLYIDDMRLLKNICNEFLVYFNRLNTTELNYDKMLAIIAYKNLFPRDFSELQLGRGFVANLFGSKSQFIEQELNSLQENTDRLLERIDYAKKEIAETLQELQIIFEKKVPSYGSRDLRYLSEENKKEYEKRKQAVEDRGPIALMALENELETLRNKQKELESYQLFEIITRDNTNLIFSAQNVNEVGTVKDYKEIRENDYFALLKYLITKGYLDETYPDYMTYFYEHSLSMGDKKFLRSITDRSAKEYTYELKDVALVCSRLNEYDFDEPETLNYSLITYLLKNEKVLYLKHLIKQLRENKKFDFIGGYFEVTSEKEQYMKVLNCEWPSLFFELLLKKPLTLQQIKAFSLAYLCYSSKEEIESINIDDCLSNYISDDSGYLNISNPNIEKVISSFNILGIKFTNLDYEHSNKQLFEKVYEKNLYELNFENIKLMLQVFGGFENTEIKHKNCTLVKSMKSDNLASYIDAHIVQYISIVLDNCDDEINDYETIALSILNDERIEVTQKETYLSFLKTPLLDIKAINSFQLWTSSMKRGILQFSEENMLEYFLKVKKIDETLLGYINTTERIIDCSFLIEKYPEDQRIEFFEACLVCEGLENLKYQQILTTLKLALKNFDIGDISDDKLFILIREKIILMNKSNLSFIRDNYPVGLAEYIRLNFTEYVAIIDENNFKHEEILQILEWDVSEADKKKLLQLDDNSISIVDKNYSSDIICYILKNNLHTKDKSFLYKGYSGFNKEIQIVILDLALKDLQDIFEAKERLDFELLKEILLNDTVKFEDKIEFLVSQFNYLDNNKLKLILAGMGLTKYLDIFDPRKKPKFEITTQNEILLQAFKTKGLIYEFIEDEKKAGFYSIRRRMPAKTIPTELL